MINIPNLRIQKQSQKPITLYSPSSKNHPFLAISDKHLNRLLLIAKGSIYVYPVYDLS